jgi:hypothetical protein
MKLRAFAAAFFALILAGALCAQDPNGGPPPSSNGGFGGGPGGFGRGMTMGMAGGRGTMGTVTETATDHFTVKTAAGEIYTVHFSANTRIMKEPARGDGAGRGQGRGWGGNPPQQIKATEIKVGDSIGAMGEVDVSAKSVGAVAIVLMDPERARQLAEMQANYGKTWLMGKVTAIDGVKITVMGSVDNAPHTFVADENTSFRERREPVTLADIQVGNVVRAEGTVKDGVFVAATVNVMRMPQGGPRMPRDGPER